MMTALCAARNILGAKHDLWAINTEPEYHEEKQERPQDSTAREFKRPAYAEPSMTGNRCGATPSAGLASSREGIEL